MNLNLLLDAVQDYISKNQSIAPAAIALKKSPFPEVTALELAQQIAGRQKTKQKLPTWQSTPGILFPAALSLEQCSSELTAKYKANLTSGKNLIDITGGFGIDSYFFSLRIDSITYCEIQSELAALVGHNFEVLGRNNIRLHIISGLDYLQILATNKVRVDWIYADPSRRNAEGGRVVNLENYLPNIPLNLESIFEVTHNLLVKTSPMLDLELGLRSLPGTREIHIVGVNNEVRELLWWVQPGYAGPVNRIAIDLGAFPAFQFTASEEKNAIRDLDVPLNYLYEPHAALMKAAPYNLICGRYGVSKLHEHTHLYTSENLVDFPGRRFKVLEILPYKVKNISFKKANITTRNFPESVAEIRKRTGIKPGGDSYLFFAKLLDESLKVIVTEVV
ncbi:MAG: hypothetical protein RLZZ241_927 [Bacteroidota bacterium]